MVKTHRLSRMSVLGCLLGVTLACGLLFAGGCQRAPRTAAELAKALPQAYAGELHLQRETETIHLRIQARELSIRSEHVLEFNRVDYQIEDAPGSANSEGEAHIRGTVTAPGFDIRLEMLGSTFSDGDDALRPETFRGQLSQDLQSVDAQWSTGLGQKARLTLHAAPP